MTFRADEEMEYMKWHTSSSGDFVAFYGFAPQGRIPAARTPGVMPCNAMILLLLSIAPLYKFSYISPASYAAPKADVA